MKSVKQIMAELLVEWLMEDYIKLINKPSEKEIVDSLEEHKEHNYGSL